MRPPRDITSGGLDARRESLAERNESPELALAELYITARGSGGYRPPPG